MLSGPMEHIAGHVVKPVRKPLGRVRRIITTMELLWIPIAMAAGLMQAVRTAAQKALSARISTWMTTYVRSLFGFPVVVIYLGIVIAFEGRLWPDVSTVFLFHCAGTAISQVLATYLLIRLFRVSNFAVGTMLTKTDVMQAALVGTVLFSETITRVGWLAIALSAVGVVLMSAGRASGPLRGIGAALLGPATALGLGSAFLFCLSYLFLREASLVLEVGSPFWRSAWALVTVTAMQVVGLGAWLAWRDLPELARLPSVMRPCLFIGLTSALGSIGWFTAMAMQNASYVKAVGQTEVIFTILISTLYFNERIRRVEYLGIAILTGAIILLVIAD